MTFCTNNVPGTCWVCLCLMQFRVHMEILRGGKVKAMKNHSFWFSVNAVFQEKVSMYANIPLLYHPRAHLARSLCCSALIREAQCSAPNAVTAY